MAYTTIDDPSAYFQTAIYSGSNSDLSVTNDGNSDLKPDFLWIKQRSSTESHMLVDSTRGVSKYLLSNSTTAELTVTSIVETLDTDGFTLNGASNPVNALGATYVGWQWKANGGTTASNTSGATTTTVQANQDAGFSILTWSGNGSATTLGHGLGVKPDVIIVKARGTTSNWAVYHKDATNGQQPYNVVTYLDLTDATGIASNSWGTVASDINSNTFYLKHWFNYNTTNVAYCFAEKQGYSKFGKYVGNGVAGNGPFVYTGFKPAWIMVKPIDAALDWFIYDNRRAAGNTVDARYNEVKSALFANSDSAGTGTSYAGVDLVSNGFKWINGGAGGSNQSGITYIYMAFAENPFVTSTGIPTTAR